MATRGSQEAAISIAFVTKSTPIKAFMPLASVTAALSPNTMVPSIGLISRVTNHGSTVFLMTSFTQAPSY